MSNLERYGLTFHHFGIAVRKEAPARTFLTGLGYEVGELITDREQSVRVAMCRGKGLPTLELVMATEEAGPITALLSRQETNIYHSCYTTQDAEASLAAIEDDGLRQMVISTPKPAILFGGRLVSFHYLSGFGLIELIHLDGIGATLV